MTDTQRDKIIRELRLRSFSSKHADLNEAVTTKVGDEGFSDFLWAFARQPEESKK